MIALEVIPPDRRRPEDEINADFDLARPKVLGALLDATAAALRGLPTVKLDSYSRMADFEKWIVAASPGLGWGDAKAFREAYNKIGKGAADAAFEADTVAVAILDFLQSDCWNDRKEQPGYPAKWSGSATQLFAALNGRAGEKVKQRWWPQSPSALSNRIERASPGLRDRGWNVDRGGRDAAGRFITITSIAFTM